MRSGPKDLEVRVVELPANTACIVIPAAPASGELSDAALETVAGGTGTWLCPTSICQTFYVCAPTTSIDCVPKSY